MCTELSTNYPLNFVAINNKIGKLILVETSLRKIGLLYFSKKVSLRIKI